MKTLFPTALTAALAVVWASPARAIEAPADDAPPPPAAADDAEAKDKPFSLPLAPPAEPAKPDAKAKVDTAYLGVASAQVPELLADHLGLKPGEGVVVQAVMPDSPAAKAGIAIHDVITHVGKEAIGSSMDLTRAVSAAKPGDTAHLSIIHKGKPAELDVALGVRPAAMAQAHPQALDQLNLDGVPKELADRVRGMIQGNLGGIDIQPGAGAPAQMEEAVREMKKRMEDAMQGFNLPEDALEPQAQVEQNAAIRLLDEKGSIELKSDNGGKEVTIRDKENQVTWTGPWDTEQDKAAAPDDVRKRVERLNLDQNFQGNGLRLKFGGIQDGE